METDLAAQGRRAYRAVETGDLGDVAEYIAPAWVNREAAAEPPTARGRGPAAFAATVRWLQTGLSDISIHEREVVVAGSTVVSAATLSARHTGPIVLQAGDKIRVAPPTGRRFAVEHVHWTEFDAEGRAVRHFARRDDLGQVTQLGLLPPTPGQLLRTVRWALTGRSAAARRVFLTTPGTLPVGTGAAAGHPRST
ncbi:ester cyclase [Georgenia sp. TF02-10]|uniref:ester cyclase n=1 Tax=Georgenia sp. TF02-10 TaxID=2917725 RepID=UPI001FA7F355|nr:ester cyclase [Georgenia sp. TF02-10]UNX53691.1 ester cyclase [Georgenia sp. TF02-10]